MPVSPTLFIGLGEFGTALSTYNHESFNQDYPGLSQLHASLNFNGVISFTYANKKMTEVGTIPVLKESSVKENFQILNKETSKFKKAIDDGIEYVFDAARLSDIIVADVEVSEKKKVIIYFSLGDNISSVSIQKTIELITVSKRIKSLELFLICINYDLLDEDVKRAFACLSELDFYLSTVSSVQSSTLLAKYGANDFGGYKKENVIPLTYALSKKIIQNQVEIITSQAIRGHITENNRKVIYNSFGSTSLVYEKDKVWQKFCDYEKISFLTSEISKIENAELHRGIITRPVSILILNNSSDSIKQQLSTDENNINLFIDVKEIILSQVAQEQPDTARDFVNLLLAKNDEYNANEWPATTAAIANNIHIIEEKYKEIISDDILSIINNEGIGIGLVKLRATLNTLLNQHDKSIDGVIIDDEVSFQNLINNQLRYFKELYKRIPVDQRMDEIQEIVFDEDLKKLQKDILNTETRIRDIKEEIVQLDRSFLLTDQETTESTIQDGYFTIAG